MPQDTTSGINCSSHNASIAPDRAIQTDEGGFGDPTAMKVLDTGPGAGPLPVGFGTPPAVGVHGSTLTEFTKKRNWTHRVVEELKDFLHVLTPDGRIIYISPSGSTLTGYPIDELIGEFIIDFIHQDDSGIFMREFNESIATGNPLRFFYRFRRKDGTYTIFESHGHPHLTSEAAQSGPNNAAGFCRGFFMMARPYPAKNAALLDSFLEHKIENERLRKRINELKREEAEDAENAQREDERMQHEGRSEVRSETDAMVGTSVATSAPPRADQHTMLPPAKPTANNSSLTQQNLADVSSRGESETMKEKMARYAGDTHIETIELFTGLDYQGGERSYGISTGDKSPALMRGDVGIAIPLDKYRGSNGKKKNKKKEEEYVCTDCGTLDSPEWRKGPTGPKTLCNACGLRWAKKEKKKTVPMGGTSGGES
ncbi:white collar-2 [Calycina marina]|uniref:White collar-2 n=1 Tax=Calycina marina TaxID=1763456 RepID=A0A9P7Z9D3_9HELO|nr:white collar-2 [Calycina marina]